MKFDKDMNVRFVSFENYGVTEGVADSGYSSAVSKIFGVDIDEDGNYVTVGCTQLSKGNTNAVISKWDGKTGELISHRMAGTDDAMEQDSIDLIDARYLSAAALTDGTYVVTGTATKDATTSEGWKCYGSADVILVRYSADLSDVLFSRNIGTVDVLSGSLTATNGTQMEGVKATRDGGYVLYGSESSKVVEADLLEDGYSWSNYGSNDGVIIKYDSSNNVCWCQNYGTSGGDWIYDVIFRQNETEITVVGQSSGQYGTPAWEWHGQAASSTNPYDAFVMCTNMYSGAYTEPKASNDALARASAQTVINAIEKVANYTSANTSNTGNVNNVLAASAPIVAAMAAAAKQVKPEMTVADFKELLKNTSQDRGDEGFDNSYGYGIVDLAAFAEKIAPQPKPEEKVEEKEQEKTETNSDKKTETNSHKKSEVSSGNSSDAGKDNNVEIASLNKTETVSDNNTSADTSLSNSASGEKLKNTAGTSSKTKKQEATDESDEKLEEDDIVQSSTVTEQAETTVEEEATESTEDEVTQISEEAGGFDSSSPIIPIVLIVLGLAVVAGFIIKKR